MIDQWETSKLEAECRTFTRYLAAADPTPDLVRAYVEGHVSIPFLHDATSEGHRSLDHATLRLARAGAFATGAADAYARVSRANGPLRQKLTLLLAILEHAPPYHTALNAGSGVGPVRATLALFGLGLFFMVSLTVGMVLLAPVHIVARLRGGRPPRAHAPGASSASGPSDDG